MTPTATPATRNDGPTDAYEGQNQRGYENANGANYTLMGARIYLPGWGQFTATDPVFCGDVNPYVYPNEPVNGRDLTGLKGGPAAANAEARSICKVSPASRNCKRAEEYGQRS